MNIHEVNAKTQSKPDAHRVGRGPGSGWGTTSGRGNNGAKCRSGWKNKLYYEGGQMPIARRIPKRGFNNKKFAKVWSFVNLNDLNQFADGDVVSAEACLKRGLIPKVRSGLKVLGRGTLERKVTIQAHRCSESAKKAIEEKGGTLELVAAPGDLAKKNWLTKRGKGRSTQRRIAAERRSGKK